MVQLHWWFSQECTKFTGVWLGLRGCSIQLFFILESKWCMGFAKYTSCCECVCASHEGHKYKLGLVYTTVEKASGRSRMLGQDMVIWGKWWMCQRRIKGNKIFLIELSFSRGVSCPASWQETPREMPNSKKRRQVGGHVILSSMRKVHRSVNRRLVHRETTCF